MTEEVRVKSVIASYALTMGMSGWFVANQQSPFRRKGVYLDVGRLDDDGDMVSVL